LKSLAQLREILINSNFVISSAAESHVYGRFCGVEKPAFVCARLNQSFLRFPNYKIMLLLFFVLLNL
jgi:hypothetical protein